MAFRKKFSDGLSHQKKVRESKSKINHSSHNSDPEHLSDALAYGLLPVGGGHVSPARYMGLDPAAPGQDRNVIPEVQVGLP